MFRHLPSNGLIEKITIRDLSLHFDGKKFENFVKETVRANVELCGRHL